MMNIRPPGTPPAHEAPAPNAATPVQPHTPPQPTKAQDTHETRAPAHKSAAGESPAQPTLALHLPVPPNLRPIRTRMPLLSLEGERHAHGLGQGGQAEAVAHGTLGLVDLEEVSASPMSGLWETPRDLTPILRDTSPPSFDMHGLSAGGQSTMRLLAQINGLADELASTFNLDRS